MILSHKCKFIFFANGKTGSKSIEWALKKYDDNAKFPLLWKIAQYTRDRLSVPSKIFPNTSNRFLTALLNIIKTPYRSKMEFGEDLPAIEHVGPSIVKEKIDNKIWNEYFKFVFVRNPWDWILSGYFSMNKEEAKNMIKFEEEHFWKYWEHSKQYKIYPEVENIFQYNWVYDQNGEKLVDFVGKYETLQEDFNEVGKRIGLPYMKLSHINRNKIRRRSYREYYTAETKQLVAELYKKDVELFEYEF